MEWTDINERLPENMDKVLCYLPDNVQFLPGKSGESRPENVVILRFVQDFFAEGSEKREKYGPHFWLGEGLSNHYMADVTHWMPLPQAP
ncbi:MAG: DUF551 domain-containing protein [Bacteroidetes bacterium]|jgi:hypothetical protein|nr:DUF551 domain-containing protein [Bacteroidota bacterium]MDA0972799.1 DUF551 domain-containing protein [Bacteroidota bacterium]